MRRHDPERKARKEYFSNLLIELYRKDRASYMQLDSTMSMRRSLVDVLYDMLEFKYEPGMLKRNIKKLLQYRKNKAAAKALEASRLEESRMKRMMYETQGVLNEYIKEIIRVEEGKLKRNPPKPGPDPYDRIYTGIGHIYGGRGLGQFEDAVPRIADMMVTTSDRFMEAAERGRTQDLLKLVKEGFPLNYQDPVTGKSALHLAATSCARPLILALIKTGVCNFLLRDKKGRLASEMAFVYGNDPALARLLRIKEVKQASLEGVKLARRPIPESKPA